MKIGKNNLGNPQPQGGYQGVTQVVRRLRSSNRADALINKIAWVITADEPSPPLLARLISSDPHFSSYFLQGLSGGLTGQTERGCKSVLEGLNSIGLEKTREILLIVGLDMLAEDLLKSSQVPSRDYSLRSVAIAAANQYMAERLGVSPFSAFCAGLMSHIGILVMAYAQPDIYRNCIKNLAGRSIPLENAEQAAFGFDHLDVGRELAEEYKLPDIIGSAMHRLGTEALNIKGVPLAVHTNSIIAQQLGYDMGLANIPPDLTEAILERLELSQSDIDEIAKRATEAASRLAKIKFV